ncbi:MAG: TRAP transporter large permease [Pseudonocardia sp.]
MGTELVVVIVVVAFLGLILLDVPVGLGLLFAGLLGIALLDGFARASTVLATTPYSAVAKYGLFVVPMYVLLGALVSHAGIGAGLYRVINRRVRHLPGGLAASAVLATAAFSGISGSSAADVASFGRVSVTEMSRHGYPRPEAAAVVAAAGAVAMLIPPSIVVVIYGIMAQESIGALILASVVPGVLSALALAAFVVVRAGVRGRRRVAASASAPRLGTRVTTGPPVAGEVAVDLHGSDAARAPGDLAAILSAGVLFTIVVGGLYSGIFTATEAGAVAALTALVIALASRRSRAGRSFTSVLRSALWETANVTSMIFLLLVAGAVLGYFVASSGLAHDIARWAVGLPVGPLAVVAALLLIMIPLGMCLDGLSVLLLTVPIVTPVVDALGYDGVWFGILMVKMIEIGLLTPPVGINVFIISGIVAIPAEQVFRRIFPFVALDLALTALFFAVPDLVMWLPRLAGLG